MKFAKVILQQVKPLNINRFMWSIRQCPKYCLIKLFITIIGKCNQFDFVSDQIKWHTRYLELIGNNVIFRSAVYLYVLYRP
jgi:hypothetical protein